MAYLTQAQIEARVSAAVFRAVFDDDNDGTADAVPVAQLIADVEAEIDGFLRGNYPLPLATVPTEITRLALDLAQGRIGQRHPEYCRYDWKSMLDMVRQSLMDLRKGHTRLNLVGEAETSVNHGGSVSSGVPAVPTVARTFLNGMGDF